MQQEPQHSPTGAMSSFAGLLAAFAAPASNAADRKPAQNDDDLEDDFATLSYERALQAHARYRPPDAIDDSLPQAANQRPIKIRPSSPSAPNRDQETTTLQPVAGSTVNPGTAQVQHSPLDRNLKLASVTIRMSHEECAQLRKRAADAGLSVSAYLRSCTFEAEALRAQVKDALAQLRSGESREKAPANASHLVKRSWLHWPRRP
ncbi:MAG: hypothetical protein WBQ94_27735 [Terracidiphilus sp.]